MSLSDSEISQQTSRWFQNDNNQPNWFHRRIMSVLKCGTVPKHIAIIMDGNRRYAQKEHVDRQKGHMKGFDKLTQTLEWCLDLGINEVTVYAFSIENFKRSAEEVNGLLNLLRVKMQDLLDDRDKLEEHGVCVRVIGNISLLPTDIQKVLAQVMTMSSGFNRAFLNVCLAYTSREEMTSAVKLVANGLVQGKLEESDVDSQLLESCLYTSSCQPVDLLIRTSGEVRLSDFLLWQSTYSLLSFLSVLWPEFSRWDLYGAVLYYQRHHQQLKDIEASHKKSATPIPEEASSNADRKQVFLEEINKMKTEEIQSMVS